MNEQRNCSALESPDLSTLAGSASRHPRQGAAARTETTMVTEEKKTLRQRRPLRLPASGWSNRNPKAYSWDDLVRDGRTDWTGVRNFQARNNLRQMKAGDSRAVLPLRRPAKAWSGIAEVAKAGYPDPTADDPQWVAVDIKPSKPLKEPVTLASIRDHPKLGDLSADSPVATVGDAGDQRRV